MNETLLLQHHLDLSIGLVGKLPQKSPHESISPQLNQLFDELGMTTPSRAVEDIEDDIWELWLENSDEELSERMQHAIAAISQQALGGCSGSDKQSSTRLSKMGRGLE